MTTAVCIPSSSLQVMGMFDQLPDIIPPSIFHSTFLGLLTWFHSQSAARCELHQFLCQCWIISTCLPKITRCLLHMLCRIQNLESQTVTAVNYLDGSFMWNMETTVSEEVVVLSAWRFLGTDTVRHIKGYGKRRCRHLGNKKFFHLYSNTIFFFCHPHTALW